MRYFKYCLISLHLAATRPLAAQLLTRHHYAKVVVPKDQSFVVDTDSIYIDTLIQYDKSRLKFAMPHTKLAVENAFLGKNCVWDASGRKGVNGKVGRKIITSLDINGGDGEDGKSIAAVGVFHELGSLAITTKGGDGGQGTNGGTDQSGTLVNPTGGGLSGGLGGNAGNGGDLTFYYLCVGFLPLFNEGREHVIFLDSRGGIGGRGGRWTRIRDSRASKFGGTPPPIPVGPSGTPGASGKDGRLVFERLIRD